MDTIGIKQWVVIEDLLGTCETMYTIITQ